MLFLTTGWTSVKYVTRWNLKVLPFAFDVYFGGQIVKFLLVILIVASPELLCNLHKESCSCHEKQNLMYFSGWMFIAMIKSFPMSPQAFLCLHQSWFFYFFSEFSFSVTFFQYLAVDLDTQFNAIESEVFPATPHKCCILHESPCLQIYFLNCKFFVQFLLLRVDFVV